MFERYDLLLDFIPRTKEKIMSCQRYVTCNVQQNGKDEGQRFHARRDHLDTFATC